MVYKVSDLLALAQELTKDNMQYVSLSELDDCMSVSATSSKSAPDSIDYDELEAVPDIEF